MLLLGSWLCVSGVLSSVKRKDTARPLQEILTDKGNHAARPAYLDIQEVPVKITESKYENYYLVTDGQDDYISGMTEKDYERVRSAYEEKGTVHLTGVTKVIIDKEAREEIAGFVSNLYGRTISAETMDDYVGDVHIRATELTTQSMLREIYALHICLGIPLLLFGAGFFAGEGRGFFKYGKISGSNAVTPKDLDREANAPGARWLPCTKIYLTQNFIAGFGDGITALRYDEIARIYGRYQQTKDEKEVFVIRAIAVDGQEYCMAEVFTQWSVEQEVSEEMQLIYAECRERYAGIACGQETETLEFVYPFYIKLYGEDFDEEEEEEPQEFSGKEAYSVLDARVREELQSDFATSLIYRRFVHAEDVFDLQMEFQADGNLRISAAVAAGKGTALREELAQFLTGQLADGWGEGYEGVRFSTDAGEYEVVFWRWED